MSGVEALTEMIEDLLDHWTLMTSRVGRRVFSQVNVPHSFDLHLQFVDITILVRVL